VGNEELSDEELRKAIGVPENPEKLLEEQTGYISGPAVEEKLKLKRLVPIGRPLKLSEIEEMKRRIILRYALEGYPNVKVSYKIVPVKGASKLVFYIKEGKPKYVKDIEIKGLKQLDDGDIKDIMELQEPNWLVFRFHPPFSKLVLENDIKNIEKFLKTKGFFEGKVEKYEVKPVGKEWVKVVIYIKEGPRYKIRKVILKGNTYFGYKELTKDFFKRLKREDNYYDEELIDFLKKQIEEKYRNLGLYRTKVYPETKIDAKSKTVDLIVHIKESKPVYNRLTRIKGNYESRDYVIRRELEIHEGDLLTEERIKWSKIWLNRLGYYANIQIRPEFLTETQAVTDVKVTERYTGQFQVGVGYSEVSGISGFVSVRKGNFLGTGDIASVTASWGVYTKNFGVSYTRKWFLRQPQDLTLSAYSRSQNYNTYNVDYEGISGTLIRRFWHYWNWSLGLDIQKVNYSSISPDASIYVKEAAKFSSATILRFNVVRDTRNSYIFPTEGSFAGIYNRIGGVLGGDEKFYKTTLKCGIYLPDKLFYSGAVLSLRASTGFVDAYGGKTVPIDERFFVGGDFTIRGYKYGYAGPLDPKTKNPIGGKTMFTASAEVDYPIKKNTFYVASFIDVGNAANDFGDLISDIKAGAGFGVRFITPMAPIRIDFAWKLKKVEGDRSSTRFHIVLGSFF
jgi:outer membrane protein insertion porin family